MYWYVLKHSHVHLCTCTDYNSDQKVPNVNSVHIAVTQWCYEGCRDLTYQMNWCDLLFALISLGVLWWKVAVLVLFSSFFTYQSWFNKAFFSWTRAASLLGPRALSSEAWLLDSMQSKWFLFPQTHSCGNKCLPVDSFSFFLPLLTSHFLSMQINGLATVTCHLCCFGNHLS